VWARSLERSDARSSRRSSPKPGRSIEMPTHVAPVGCPPEQTADQHRPSRLSRRGKPLVHREETRCGTLGRVEPRLAQVERRAASLVVWFCVANAFGAPKARRGVELLGAPVICSRDGDIGSVVQHSPIFSRGPGVTGGSGDEARRAPARCVGRRSALYSAVNLLGQTIRNRIKPSHHGAFDSARLGIEDDV
jgi:hypothetical protein